MKSRIVLASAILAALAVPLAFHAQGPIEPRVKSTPQQDRDKQNVDESRTNIRVETSLVLIPVEVSDNLNRPVAGLDKENFKVFDDKIEQKIVSFAMEDDPIAVGLVFDISGSMAGALRQTRGAAEHFFRTANPGDEFCLVTLASEAKLAVSLTERPSDIDSALTTKGGGSTALLDGIYLALNEVRKSKKLRKAIIIISDGGDNNSRYTETEVVNATRETDTLIYAIGVFGTGAGSNYSDQEVLKSLTKATGGRMFPTNGLPIQDFADKIVTDLRNRYVLGYAPTNPAKDGRFHHVEIKLAPPKGLPKLSAHWKTGYYAPTE